MPAALSAHNIAFAHEPGSPLLHGLSLEAMHGELLGLIGPNGAGKSTLLRLLAGLAAPHSGAIMLEGRPITAWSRQERARRLGYLPQFVPVATGMCVADAVAMGRYPHQRGLGLASAEDDAAVQRAMNQLGIGAFASRLMETLSGGERQRVLLASMLAQETPILLLDEPAAALDPHHQSDIFHLLQRLARSCGVLVVVVIHDLNLGALFCDRLALLDDGAIQAIGSPRDVLREEILERPYAGAVMVDQHPRTGAPLVTLREVAGT